VRPFQQMHDPGLGLLELKAQFTQDRPKRGKRRLSLPFRMKYPNRIATVIAVPALAAAVSGEPTPAIWERYCEIVPRLTHTQRRLA
jgi:hypothetical protein